jgi:hypothetical protein
MVVLFLVLIITSTKKKERVIPEVSPVEELVTEFNKNPNYDSLPRYAIRTTSPPWCLRHFEDCWNDHIAHRDDERIVLRDYRDINQLYFMVIIEEKRAMWTGGVSFTMTETRMWEPDKNERKYMYQEYVEEAIALYYLLRLRKHYQKYPAYEVEVARIDSLIDTVIEHMKEVEIALAN